VLTACCSPRSPFDYGCRARACAYRSLLTAWRYHLFLVLVQSTSAQRHSVRHSARP
jgi:hypothetical protein